MSTAKTGTDVGTWRRQRAWELHPAGWWPQDRAVAWGVSRGALSQWMVKRGREGGVEALRPRPRAGGPAKLTEEHRAQIAGLLARGAPAYGVGGDVWTARRISAVIGRRLGVRSHPDHVRRLLRQAGCSVQRLIQRATHRDEAAIQRWQQERWPALRKKAVEAGSSAVWGADSGCSRLPHAERTGAPTGATPVRPTQQAHPPPALSAQRQHARWAAVPAGAGVRGRLGGSGGLPAGAATHDPRHGARDLGWLAHAHGATDPGLPRAGSR